VGAGLNAEIAMVSGTSAARFRSPEGLAADRPPGPVRAGAGKRGRLAARTA